MSSFPDGHFLTRSGSWHWTRKRACIKDLRSQVLANGQHSSLQREEGHWQSQALLWLAGKEKHVTQVMLAHHSKLDVMMTSQVLRTLESRGLLLRHSHPTDTRAKVLELTQSERDLVVAAIPLVEGIDDTFLGGKGEQRNALNREFGRLISNR